MFLEVSKALETLRVFKRGKGSKSVAWILVPLPHSFLSFASLLSFLHKYLPFIQFAPHTSHHTNRSIELQNNPTFPSNFKGKTSFT
jgi:hypothetical protein